MQNKEFVVSIFALVILMFFCSPIFGLAIGMWNSVPPKFNGAKDVRGFNKC